MREIYLIVHNIRSTYNVGSLLRTAEGLGVIKVFLTGYTPYPRVKNDKRLPHIADKLTNQIHKTALGAENTVNFVYLENLTEAMDLLSRDNIMIAALEQTKSAVPMHKFNAPDKLAVLLGEEVDGIPIDILVGLDTHLVIPMYGQKESFNVASAAAMALFSLRFYN